MELETAAERAVLDDPLARLEHGIEDKLRAKETRSRLLELRADAEAKYADDYAINKALRAKNRSACCRHDLVVS
jgi:coiled-coil domain-containing protein 130